MYLQNLQQDEIFVPSEIFWETEVSVAPAEIDKLEQDLTLYSEGSEALTFVIG